MEQAFLILKVNETCLEIKHPSIRKQFFPQVLIYGLGNFF